MASITGDFVAKLAAVWHRFTVSEEDRETLATMLVPMDEAGERAVRHLAFDICLLYTSPSPRDRTRSRMPSSA